VGCGLHLHSIVACQQYQNFREAASTGVIALSSPEHSRLDQNVE
jgi:hypothetical protein